MTNYIPDSSKTRWMASNPKRLTRTGMDGKPFRCPFDEGNEGDTPPEVYRVGGGVKDKPGWQIRVVPNLFPITDIHEVIIHSPDHEKNIEDFSPDQIKKIIEAYINRFNALKNKGKVFIFQNYSLVSGASLVHPHSQLSVVPNEVPTNTIVAQSVENIVEQNDNFVSYCPTYSEWAYEIWLKALGQSKFESLTNKEIEDFAAILQKMTKKLKKLHAANAHYSKKPFGYNFYLALYGDWYLRIIPRFMERAGFEFSTGIMVNSVEGKKAAEDLKNV